jgi:capsular polysaccharide transport system ATP-binding protein
MITLQNLCKSFVLNGVRRVVADDLTMTFPAGKSVALLGRNGAGKSTLLAMIAGTTRYDSGLIHSPGTISWPVGFRGSFHPDLTGAQNTRFVARVYGVDTDELEAFARDFADLGEHFHLPVRSYSAGMRSRLSFGLSMGIHFDTYLVDEVTSVGDAVFKKKSSQLFRDRLQRSSAIVVTHSMKQVRDLCDAAAVLEGGRITYFDNVEDGIEQHLRNMKLFGDEDADADDDE